MHWGRRLLAVGCCFAVTGTSVAASPVGAFQGIPEIPASDSLDVVPIDIPVVDVAPVPPAVELPAPVARIVPTAPAPPPDAGSAAPAPRVAPRAFRPPPVPVAAGPSGSAAPAVAVAGGGTTTSAARTTVRQSGLATGAARRDRRLRRTIRDLRRCLSTLPRAQARVLSLRAGLGPGAALSRAEVAVDIDRSVGHVRRVERRAVAKLRGVRRTRGCGGAAAPATGGDAGASLVASGAGTTTATTAATSAGAPGAIAGGDAGGRGGSGSSDRGGVKGESRQGRSPIAGLIPRAPQAVELTLPIVVALCAIGWLAGRRVVRRRAAA